MGDLDGTTPLLDAGPELAFAEAEAALEKFTETEVADTDASETEVSETEASETEAAETEAAEAETSETEAAEAEVSETEVAEIKAAAAAAATAKNGKHRQRREVSNLNGPFYMQRAKSNVVLVRRLKRKEDSTWTHLASWFVENQIGLSVNLMLLMFLAHALLPRARQYTRKFFHLSYYNAKTEGYGSGFDDVYLITFFIVLFTALRAMTMEYVLAPFAKLQGITKRKDLTRFSEQAWLLIYYLVVWPTGMYIYCNSPFYLNLKELWTDWPVREIGGLMKLYVLAQWAFWLQQIIVINIEERRKDHWQMFAHHIITTALITACYCYHHTRVGSLILVIMDVVDLFLPFAKCLRYCGYKTLCDMTFGLFMVSWFTARHVIYLMICWSVYTDSVAVPTLGCYTGKHGALVGPSEPPAGWTYLLEPFYNPTGRVCYNYEIMLAFLTPLLLLQGLTVVWFSMIIRVASKVIRGQGAEDSRSDGEDDDEEEEEEEAEKKAEEETETETEREEEQSLDDDKATAKQPMEKEVGVEEIDFQSWERRTGFRRHGSTGVGLPGHSGKELLGRIGCEKTVD